MRIEYIEENGSHNGHYANENGGKQGGYFTF